MQVTRSHLMRAYARQPVSFVRGSGARLWDDNGVEYLDAIAGVAVTSLGHAHPEIAAVIAEQAGMLLHTSNVFRIDWQERLGERLCALTGMQKAFFCNSGAEANETALKLARLHGHRQQIAEPKILVMENGFHGRTIATLSATGNVKVQQGFEPLVEGFVRVPLNDIAAMRSIAASNPNVSAVFLETIQGEGGINPARWDYLRELRQLCDEQGWLLMLDEVQCGIGRTGKWFAHQWAGIVPDVMPLAKGLGSGVPVGAIVVGPKAQNVLGPGNHGTTFGGNPLAMRAGIETLEIMIADGLMDNAARVGAHLKESLQRDLAGLPGYKEIRGQGLMLGIELDRPCGVILSRAMEAGLLLSVTADSVIRLVPPLILSVAEADEIVALLVPLIKTFLSEAAA